jgi:NAD(P)-dependent dehydrogenase (short-subunit alcohol dehydrogenase family)
MTASRKRYENKIVLVTGGATGIGKITSAAFAREGASVVFTDLSAEHGPAFEAQLREQGWQARFVQSDVTDPTQSEGLIADIAQRHGRLDVAVNNAGGILAPDELGTGVHDTLEEGWNKNIALNLSGVFLGMKYQIRQMLKQGGGAIVNTGSIAGLIVDVDFTSLSYSTAKAGMIHMSKWAAVMYAKNHIRVNVVAPAAVATEATKAFLSDEMKSFLAGQSPMQRMSEPEEIANATLWLCSDEAYGVTGVTLPVDGGIAAK